MKKAELKIGLLGLGRLGRIYAGQLARQIAGARLVAVADPLPDRAKQIAEEWGVEKSGSDPLGLIDDPQVDAVVIASPTHTHKELVIAAARRNKKIFCEKPLSLSLREAIEIKEAVDHSGAFFQMGLMRRFDRGYAAAKKRIEQGVIGRPLVFKASSRDPFLPALEYLDPKTSGGIFIDMGIHDFDLALWLIGRVRTVTSIGGVLAFPQVEEMGDIDNAIVTLIFEEGQLGVVDLSRSGLYGYDISADILGSAGTLRVGYLRETPVLVMTKDGVAHDVVPYFPERFGQAYRDQLQNFVDNVRAGRPAPVTLADGIEALRVSVAATESFRTGRPVEIAAISEPRA
ncbi:MAG TPA: Gfo/Idh/MocA family oxidoreductase [Acidobacteriota bacterium]|jgi:inositol 2-dehydrogenase